MDVKSTVVIDWVNQNLPPLSWQIIVMKLMKVLMTNGIRPARIDDSVNFNDEITSAIRDYIKENYQKDLPKY